MELWTKKYKNHQKVNDPSQASHNNIHYPISNRTTWILPVRCATKLLMTEVISYQSVQFYKISERLHIRRSKVWVILYSGVRTYTILYMIMQQNPCYYSTHNIMECSLTMNFPWLIWMNSKSILLHLVICCISRGGTYWHPYRGMCSLELSVSLHSHLNHWSSCYWKWLFVYTAYMICKLVLYSSCSYRKR